MESKETAEGGFQIDLTKLCYYDKRNPDCAVDDEDIEAHKKSLLEKNKICICDNCFYGRTKLTEQLIFQAERMYTLEQILEEFIGEGSTYGLFNKYLNYKLDTSNYEITFKEWFKEVKNK